MNQNSTSAIATLTQAELLALAISAAKEGDDGRSMAYLKEATGRPDATAQVHFLLGSQYAQVGLVPEALHHMGSAVALAPTQPLFRFQLGLLQLSSALPQDAQRTWEPLLTLGDDEVLAVYARGLCHLMRDEYSPAQICLEQGLSRSALAPTPTDGDMQRVLASVKAVLAEQDGRTVAERSTQPAPEDVAADHLFLNIYKDGKVH